MIVDFPLTKYNRILLGGAFRSVPRVDLAIDCVLEAQMGRAFVDDLDCPTIFQIQTGPFAYFAGDPSAPSAQEFLGRLTPYMLFMPSAPGWVEAAAALYGEKLHLFDRYSFSPASLSAEHLSRLHQDSSHRDVVKQMDRPLVEWLWGREHFVDLSDYDSVDDFLQRGIGFYVGAGQDVFGAASAALVCSRGIEISIYIEEAYRCQGMATALASRLLLWCLEHHLEPHWDAANPESCKLAMKLGYKPTGSYLAYYLAE